MKKKQTDLEKKLEQAIYTNRMIVLLEHEDGFRQFIFTPEHFKKVSDAVAAGYKKVDTHKTEEGEHDVLDVEMSDEVIPLEPFEGLQDFYEEEDEKP